MIRKLDFILNDSSDKMRELKHRSPEIKELLNEGSTKWIIDPIDFDERGDDPMMVSVEDGRCETADPSELSRSRAVKPESVTG